MVITPGDLMLGDEDGLLCVPFEATDTVYAAAKAKRDAEDKQMEAIKAGRSDRAWVDAQLTKLGCELSG
jgi:regulator of RNase E activity RraA